MASHRLSRTMNKRNLKKYQEGKYYFSGDSTVLYSGRAHVNCVGISTHAFLSGLRGNERGEHLMKASLEVPEPSVTCGSLKYRVLASCLCQYAWK